MKILSKIIAWILKCIILCIPIYVAYKYYDVNSNYLKQHILVYIFIYIPIIIGYEYIIEIILEKKK